MSRNIIGTSNLTEVQNACKRFITHGPKDWSGHKHHKSKDDRDPSTHPSNEYVIINVSGSVFKTKSETLLRFPDTLLGSSDKLKYYDERSGELFFDRHSPTFPSILYYYQSNGQIHKPTSVSMSLFREELSFFRIKWDHLDDPHKRWSYSSPNEANLHAADTLNSNPAYQFASQHRPLSRNGSGYMSRPHLQRRETVAAMHSTPAQGMVSVRTETPGHMRNNSIIESSEDRKIQYSPLDPYEGVSKQQKIYNLLDTPESSNAARIFSWVSMGLIVFSVASFVAETMPVYKADMQKLWWETQTGLIFFVLESFCIGFFTVELIGRFVFCPNKSKFCRNTLNIVDVISILPYYIELIIPKGQNFESISSLFILRVLRLFRVLRIFKLSRHSKSMIAFGVALKASLEELLMLGLFLLIDVILFASALYYTEMDVKDTKFESIPSACWWAVVTVTTLGYGDMCPETTFGKIMGTACVISGILVIAFQMPIMVAKFTWSFMQTTADSPSNGMEYEYEDEEDDEDGEKSTTYNSNNKLNIRVPPTSITPNNIANNNITPNNIGNNNVANNVSSNNNLNVPNHGNHAAVNNCGNNIASNNEHHSNIDSPNGNDTDKSPTNNDKSKIDFPAKFEKRLRSKSANSLSISEN